MTKKEEFLHSDGTPYPEHIQKYKMHVKEVLEVGGPEAWRKKMAQAAKETARRMKIFIANSKGVSYGYGQRPWYIDDDDPEAKDWPE